MNYDDHDVLCTLTDGSFSVLGFLGRLVVKGQNGFLFVKSILLLGQYHLAIRAFSNYSRLK